MTPEEQAAAKAAADKAAADAQATAEADAKAAADRAAADKKETIGQVLDPDKPAAEAKVVPEAAFLNEKKERKALEKRVKELEAAAKDGASEEEISADIDAIGEEFGVDKKFLSKLATAIEKKSEDRFQSKLKPIEAKEREDRIESIFGTHFDKAMTEMPEFSKVVNRDVIKSLSLDPKNNDKTFAQLIEDTYGKAVPGKRTFESTTHRGGNAPIEVDVERATHDPKYYDEVMADPALKAEYNKGLTERISAAM